VQILSDADLARRLGDAARQTVQDRFLLTRYLEQYLDLFGAFETHYTVRQASVEA
jgi:trehalose synthase